MIIVSENNRISAKDQVMDGNKNPGYKWFSLQDNILDGTYHPADSSGVLQIGWWGTSLSDNDGYFSIPPSITIQNPLTIHTLFISGDSILNEYPVDFVVELYDGLTLLHTENVIGNNNIEWKKNLDSTYETTEVIITISRINKASRSVKLLDSTPLFELIRSTSISVNSSTAIEDLHLQGKTSSLPLTLTVNSHIRNVYTMMIESERHIFGKVRIIYSDPFVDQTIVMAASETGRYTYIEQTADNYEVPLYKWFALHNNKLDGSFHPISAHQDVSVGWW
jgi:hypothetical protein